jgi:hypothetical protein
MLAVSEAKSVSVMRLFDADRFSVVDCRFEIADVEARLQCASCARWPLTFDSAASAILIAFWAPSKV